MNKIKLLILFISIFGHLLSCEKPIEPIQSKCDSLSTILTGNWIASYVRDNPTGKKIDSSKCVDGIPYDFFGGEKVEKNKNEPPTPMEILDFADIEYWEFNKNDSLYIERSGGDETYWFCVNDQMGGIVSGIEFYNYSLGWDCKENTFQIFHADLKDNTQIFNIIDLTDSTFWLKIQGEEKTLKLYKKEN